MRLTGSRLPLATHCAWWARPEVDAPPRPSSADAEVGTEVHAAIAAMLAGQPEPAHSDEADPYLRAWRTAAVARDGWRPEVAVAYDPATDTAVEVPAKGGHRDYSGLSAGIIAGTADAVRVDPAGVVVADWKCAAGIDLHADPASDNLQIAFYALALCRAHGATEARVCVVRIDADGVTEDWHDLDAAALDAVSWRVAEIVAAIPRSRPTPGPWCAERWCPALAVCPAAAASTEAMILATAPAPLAITADNAPRLLARLDLAEAACEAVRAGLRAYADAAGGIPLADGRIWRRHEEARESVALDGPAGAEALAILARHGCAGAVREKRTASWDAIRDVLREAYPGRDAAQARKELEGALRADLAGAGAIKRAIVGSYRAGRR